MVDVLIRIALISRNSEGKPKKIQPRGSTLISGRFGRSQGFFMRQKCEGRISVVALLRSLSPTRRCLGIFFRRMDGVGSPPDLPMETKKKPRRNGGASDQDRIPRIPLRDQVGVVAVAGAEVVIPVGEQSTVALSPSFKLQVGVFDADLFNDNREVVVDFDGPRHVVAVLVREPGENRGVVAGAEQGDIGQIGRLLASEVYLTTAVAVYEEEWIAHIGLQLGERVRIAHQDIHLNGIVFVIESVVEHHAYGVGLTGFGSIAVHRYDAVQQLAASYAGNIAGREGPTDAITVIVRGTDVANIARYVDLDYVEVHVHIGSVIHVHHEVVEVVVTLSGPQVFESDAVETAIKRMVANERLGRIVRESVELVVDTVVVAIRSTLGIHEGETAGVATVGNRRGDVEQQVVEVVVGTGVVAVLVFKSNQDQVLGSVVQIHNVTTVGGAGFVVEGGVRVHLGIVESNALSAAVPTVLEQYPSDRLTGGDHTEANLVASNQTTLGRERRVRDDHLNAVDVIHAYRRSSGVVGVETNRVLETSSFKYPSKEHFGGLRYNEVAVAQNGQSAVVDEFGKRSVDLGQQQRSDGIGSDQVARNTQCVVGTEVVVDRSGNLGRRTLDAAAVFTGAGAVEVYAGNTIADGDGEVAGHTDVVRNEIDRLSGGGQTEVAFKATVFVEHGSGDQLASFLGSGSVDAEYGTGHKVLAVQGNANRSAGLIIECTGRLVRRVEILLARSHSETDQAGCEN